AARGCSLCSLRGCRGCRVETKGGNCGRGLQHSPRSGHLLSFPIHNCTRLADLPGSNSGGRRPSIHRSDFAKERPMPNINTGDFRKGIKVIVEGDPYEMLECNFVK